LERRRKVVDVHLILDLDACLDGDGIAADETLHDTHRQVVEHAAVHAQVPLGHYRWQEPGHEALACSACRRLPE